MNRQMLVALGIWMCALPAAAAGPAVTAELKNIPYVENGGPDQVMDLSWPRTAPKATILFIHGGSLEEAGERRTSPPYRNVCKPFVAAGMACASMDYRLAPSHSWPAMPNDVAAAVAKLRQLVVQRGWAPKRIFLFGHSSGCHLAAVLGTNATYLRSVGLTPADLAGVIAMGCTLDREDAALRGLTADRIREPFAQDREEVAKYGTAENWLAANPASFVGPHTPPTLVVVARAERFMPPVLEQGARFVRRLLELGIAADLVLVPGKHMESIAALGKPGDPTFDAIRVFIEK
ncbi:MAG: alpha/beta hydrolase [Thermoanaerobaculia bacterium]